jgi:acyl carrier protein
MLEKRFEVEIPEDVANTATVGGVVESVRKLLLTQV